MSVFRCYEDWAEIEGKELGVSEYLTITQEQINAFADATLDHQWIHTDVERAKKESHFGATIAHGYLTVSLIPHLVFSLFELENNSMVINYAINDLKFSQPVIVNSKVRLKVDVAVVKNLKGIAKVTYNIALEIESNQKPAYTGSVTILYKYS
jgi:acyl dehydratase